jgi:hypothetical protein
LLFAARFQEHVVDQISAVDPRDHSQAQVVRQLASMRSLRIRLIARHNAEPIRIEYEIRGTRIARVKCMDTDENESAHQI